MARYSEDREDLMRDAVALIERVEIELDDLRVVIGFRRNDAGSLYVLPDLAYHFNQANELRRAIDSDVLYKAEARRLISLRRERSATEVILRRREVSITETRYLLDQFEAYRGAILSGERYCMLNVHDEIPAGGAVFDRAIGWLKGLRPPLVIAATPRVS